MREFDGDVANQKRGMTVEEMRAGRLFPGNRGPHGYSCKCDGVANPDMDWCYECEATNRPRFGIFKWHPDPRYHQDTPLATYTNEKVAERECRRLNDEDPAANVVVRPYER